MYHAPSNPFIRRRSISCTLETLEWIFKVEQLLSPPWWGGGRQAQVRSPGNLNSKPVGKSRSPGETARHVRPVRIEDYPCSVSPFSFCNEIKASLGKNGYLWFRTLGNSPSLQGGKESPLVSTVREHRVINAGCLLPARTQVTRTTAHGVFFPHSG